MPAKKHSGMPKTPQRGKARVEYLKRYITNLNLEIKDTNDEETKKELRSAVAAARAEIKQLGG